MICQCNICTLYYHNNDNSRLQTIKLPQIGLYGRNSAAPIDESRIHVCSEGSSLYDRFTVAFIGGEDLLEKHAIALRPAKPILEEGRCYARFLDMAAEGFFRFMLGRRSVDILARAYLEPDHDLSYRNVTFAVRDGDIVGMVSGYTAEQHRRSSKNVLKGAAGRFNLRMLVVSTLFAPIMRIIDTIADEDFYVQAIAVDRALRGAGVGSVLLDSIEEQAGAFGSTRLALDVSAGNKSARKVYEHRGWTITSQWPKLLAIPPLTFFRMTKVMGGPD